MRRFIERQEGFRELRPFLAVESSRQSSAAKLAAEFLGARKVTHILDLGCGKGRSIELFRQIAPTASWRGVDIADSPEVRSREGDANGIDTFDGVNLPYAEDSFDLIFSRQVLEHVRHPEPLLREVRRVLRPNGLFIASFSYLEPYHSRSIFNLTPYGAKCVVQDTGLRIVSLRPGIDALTLIFRQLAGGKGTLGFFENRQSPLNALFAALRPVLGLSHQHANYLKLQFCGHACIVALKDSA